MTSEVDSYRWLPRSLAGYYRDMELPRRDSVPFASLKKPLADARIAAITTGGVHLNNDPPFDLERERHEPTWGDPTFRILPRDVNTDQVDVSHLHYNPDDALEDLDVVVPVPLLRRVADEGAIGGVTARHYSFMGYQPDPSELIEQHLPGIVPLLREDGADAIVLTPA